MRTIVRLAVLTCMLVTLAGCAATTTTYHDSNMDFATLRTVAVLPFANLSRETQAAERVRDVFINMLLATGAMYVLPTGEVARGISRGGIANPTAPSVDEAIKLGGSLKADAIITGVVREYGELRSGSAEANIISVSIQLLEAQTGKVIWTATSTKGGIGLKERLLGGGGESINKITEQAVNELLDKLFK